jgi:site-specific DNA recombinase
MYGKHPRASTFYVCRPAQNNRGRADKHTNHPSGVYLYEEPLMEAVTHFFAERVFGPDRRELLTGDLAKVDNHAAHARHTERERLRRFLNEIDRRQKSILRQAQDNDADPFTQGLRSTYNDLETQKTTTLATLAELETTDTSMPIPSEDDLALLDALPHLQLNLADAPETQLRRLFEITQLNVHLREYGAEATISIKLPADELPQAARAAEMIVSAMPSTTRLHDSHAGGGCTDVVRAPDGIRTRTGSDFKSPASAVGLRGPRQPMLYTRLGGRA